jgi:hypothetical protein
MTRDVRAHAVECRVVSTLPADFMQLLQESAHVRGTDDPVLVAVASARPQ